MNPRLRFLLSRSMEFWLGQGSQNGQGAPPAGSLGSRAMITNHLNASAQATSADQPSATILPFSKLFLVQESPGPPSPEVPPRWSRGPLHNTSGPRRFKRTPPGTITGLAKVLGNITKTAMEHLKANQAVIAAGIRRASTIWPLIHHAGPAVLLGHFPHSAIRHGLSLGNQRRDSRA